MEDKSKKDSKIESVMKHDKVKFFIESTMNLWAQLKNYIKSNETASRMINKVKTFYNAHKKKISVVLSLLIILVVVVKIIIPMGASTTKRVRTVRSDVWKMSSVDFVDELSVMGLVRGGDSVDVGFQVAGMIGEVLVNEGQFVNKGDLLATLDPTDARLKVEYNESKLKAAQKKVEVHEQLFRLKNIIKAKLDEVKYEYESQLKELEFARRELEKTRLIAPVSGLVGPIELEQGELVTPNTKVSSLYNVAYVYVDLGIIEKDIGKISKGQKIKAQVDAYPDSVKTGELVTISPVIEGKSRNFKVTAKLINNDQASLFLPGMFTRAKLEVFAADKSLVVPVTALKENEVYLVRDGKAIAQEVAIAYKSYDYAVISSGLAEGDLVVAELEGDFSDEPKIEIINEREYEV